MSHTHELNVHIGQVHIGRNGDVLKALLGSCVGIALLWKSRKVCGLAHCLLPVAPTKLTTIGGRFVSQAIPSLLALMHVQPEEYSDIQAVVAGGGNMTNPQSINPSELIGSVNARTAINLLNELRIPVIHQDLGGEEGRRIVVFCSSGEYVIERIPRLIAA